MLAVSPDINVGTYSTFGSNGMNSNQVEEEEEFRIIEEKVS